MNFLAALIDILIRDLPHYIYIYIYAFSRHFYPKGLTVHLGHTFLSVCDYINVYKTLYTTTNKIKLWLTRMI